MKLRWKYVPPHAWHLVAPGGVAVATVTRVMAPGEYVQWYYEWTAGDASGTAELYADAQRACRRALAAASEGL